MKTITGFPKRTNAEKTIAGIKTILVEANTRLDPKTTKNNTINKKREN